MERKDRVSTTATRDKLGLALAGGGFRASIFHLGVLRRMAELDLLRRVEVISTVSGGSIVGALYALLLKRDLEAAEDGNLTREQYIAIVDDVDRLLLRGIRKNLRTRLMMNPFGVLRVMLTSQSLGKRMARLYERYIYADVVDAIREAAAEAGVDTAGGRADGHADGPDGGRGDDEGGSGTGEAERRRRRMRPGELPLRELRIHPGGRPLGEGTEDYNREAREAGRSVSTRLVLNATSLNSGARFWFSSVEVGDWYLGHVRHGELDELELRKPWLDESPEEIDRQLRDTTDPATRRALAMARWWVDDGDGDRRPPDGHFDALFAIDGFPGKLPDADPGLLRQARLPAWYLAHGPHRDPPATGGLDPDGHWVVLWDALGRIDGDLAASLKEACARDRALGDELLHFLVELYWIQSAGLVAERVDHFWRTVSVGDAVGASANFPPVFPPFQMLGLYDDLHVTRLGLTDGGVFDNVGLTALEDEGCTQIIASDTGGLFREMKQVPDGRLPMIGRLISIFQSVLGSTQREALRERRRVSRELEPRADDDRALTEFLVGRELTDLAYFHIDSDPVDPRDGASDFPALADYPAPPPAYDAERRRLLAGLRTDLDAFSEQEVAALVNHGYTTADRYIRRYFKPRGEPESLWTDAWDKAPEVPRPVRVDDDTLDRTLAAGGGRFFRGLGVGAPLTWIFTLAAAAATLWLTWPVRLSVQGVFDWLGHASVTALHAMAPWLRADWTDQIFSLGMVIAAAVVLLVAIPKLIGAAITAWAEGSRRKRRVARRLTTAGKWARALVGNLLWVFGAFPVVISFGAAALAWVSDTFFARPYLRATRNRE